MESVIKTALFLVFTLVLITSAGAADTEQGAVTEVVFTPKVSDLGRSTAYILQGKSLKDTIELALPGRIYNPPLEVDVITKKSASRKTVEKAIASLFSAYKADDPEWILSGWLIQDREKISKMLESDLMHSANRDFFRSRRIKEILGYVDYGEYKIVIVRYDGDNESTRLETYKKEDGEWKATMSLSQDRTMDILYSSVIKSTYFSRRKLDALSRK